MANPKKAYFLTPSFDYPPPPLGPITLGSILSDPSAPDHPLASSSASPPASCITTTTKTDWKSTLNKSNSASIGLYAKFLDTVLGAGADASVNWDRGDGNEYAFDRLETMWFDVHDGEGRAWLNEALEGDGVKAFLAKRRGLMHPPVYIVTGLKVVRGGKIKSSKTRGRGGALSVGLDGTGVAVPVEAGPEFEVQRSREEGVEWGGSDDFVFAYRVSRVKVKKRSGEVVEEGYTKGALFGLKEDKDGNVVVGGGGFEIDEVEGDAAIAEEFGEEELVDVEDDEEECVCMLPEMEM
jgi:hypothetical protein